MDENALKIALNVCVENDFKEVAPQMQRHQNSRIQTYGMPILF